MSKYARFCEWTQMPRWLVSLNLGAIAMSLGMTAILAWAMV